MRTGPAGRALSLLVVAFLPVAMLGWILSANEYADQGIRGAVDCDGPLGVMLFAVPSLGVYAAGAVHHAALLRGARRSRSAALLLVLCVGMVFASGRKIRAAYGEKTRPEHRETCGEGW
jgi:hypothetical protein